MSNAANKKTVIGWVVVDRAEGCTHVGEPCKTRRAAEGAALLANVSHNTATRFEARPVHSD